MRKCASIRRPATLVTAAFPWMALALSLTTLSALAGTLNSIKLRMSGKEVALKSPAVFDGHEVYLPLDALPALGASFTVTHREETVILVLPNGMRAEVALARPGRAPMVPLSAVLKQLGLKFIIREGICDLRRESDPPSVVDSEPVVKPTAVRQDSARAPGKQDRSPSKQADLQRNADDHEVQETDSVDGGTTTAKTPAAPTGAAPTRSQTPHDTMPSRTANDSAKPNSGRVANSGGSEALGQSSKGAANADPPRAVVQTPSGVELSSRGSTGPLRTPFEIVGPPPPPVSPTRTVSVGVRVADVSFESTGAQSARIKIKTEGRVAAATKLLSNPSRLAIDLPNTALTNDQRDWAIDHKFLSAIHAVDGDKPGCTRIILDLSRLVSYRMMPPEPDGITINLGLPRGVGRKVSELTVVVDPGHGGSEGPNPVGASVVQGGACIMEKNLTLAIAKRVQRLLEDEGATVVMTRTKDVSVDLRERPRIAMQSNADLFVSIHIDDCPRPNSASGTTAYYSKDDPNGRALAHSIVENIAGVSGLPNRRARSDRERFAGTGMAVLHTGAIPSTLVEIGYINNATDRAKLIDPEFQDLIAQAIVEGIRGYVEAALPENIAGPTAAESTGSNH